MSNIINKVKDVLPSDSQHRTNEAAGATTNIPSNTYTTSTSGTAEGATGPHSSRLANAIDPRVDSDMDGSRRVGTTAGNMGGAGPHSVGKC